jgi:hydroxymethylglutaryl-CoA reductase
LFKFYLAGRNENVNRQNIRSEDKANKRQAKEEKKEKKQNKIMNKNSPSKSQGGHGKAQKTNDFKAVNNVLSATCGDQVMRNKILMTLFSSKK